MGNKLFEIKELLVFFKKNQIFLIPFVLMLVIIGLIIISVSTSPISIFLYPLI